MHIRAADQSPRKIEIPMTPMIDVVFQMLVFFIMTFNIVPVEGEYQIKLPVAAGGTGPMELLPPFHVRLAADAQGGLAHIQLGDKPLADFAALRAEIADVVSILSPEERGELYVKFDCDAELHYAETMQAIDACVGVRAPDGSITELVKDVRFVRRR